MPDRAAAVAAGGRRPRRQTMRRMTNTPTLNPKAKCNWAAVTFAGMPFSVNHSRK